MDSFEELLKGTAGLTSADYYYKVGKSGKKIFYVKSVDESKDRVIAKNQIPKRIPIDSIKPKDDIIDVAELINLRDGYLKELDILKIRIDNLNEKIKNHKPLTDEDLKRIAEEQKVYRADRKRRVNNARAQAEESMKRGFYAASDRARNNTPKPPPQRPAPPKKSILEELRINNKEEWKEWLRKNHPDKNNNAQDEKVGQVIAEGRAKGW